MHLMLCIFIKDFTFNPKKRRMENEERSPELRKSEALISKHEKNKKPKFLTFSLS
jgi:hypothetical protein